MNNFFVRSDFLDKISLKPLSHIHANWELSWDTELNNYRDEEDSFAVELNRLIDQLKKCPHPKKYHDNEDCLAEYVRDILKWPIYKEGNLWKCNDYAHILELGAQSDIDEENLMKAASGRIFMALKFGQKHFDEMEDGHRKILGSVISIILYQRT